MMWVRSKLVVLFLGISLFAACGSKTEPATPVETFKIYTAAIKKKDITTMKLLLSKETIKMHELEAQSQNVPVDEIVKRETIFSEHQDSVKYRNEKVDGNKATLEVQNSFGAWETLPFVMEDSQWKIDKKGFADQLMDENEKSNQELDNLHKQGQPQP